MVDQAALEVEKRKFLGAVEGWPGARMRFRPGAGEWSAGEVLDHVVKTEERILGAMKRGVATPHGIGMRDRVGTWFVHRIFRTDRRVKVPGAASSVLPDAEVNLEEVLQRWEATRGEFAGFEEGLSPELARVGLFKHPVAGWMGVGQVREFFLVHMVHHGFQIRRIERAARGPEV